MGEVLIPGGAGVVSLNLDGALLRHGEHVVIFGAEIDPPRCRPPLRTIRLTAPPRSRPSRPAPRIRMPCGGGAALLSGRPR